MFFKTRSFLRSLRDQDIDNLNDELIKKFDFAKKFIGSFPTAQFRIHVSIILIQWIQYLASLFENEGYKCNLFIKDKTKPTKYFDETTGFDTSSSVQIYEIYSEWYPKNKKILPENLIITPNILLHWYIGDGSFSKNALYLSTLNFTESEVEKLTKILFRDVGIKCKPRKVRDGFEIYISMEKENLARFFNYLEKANASTLQIAKRVFGWKFDRNLSYESFLEINHLI